MKRIIQGNDVKVDIVIKVKDTVVDFTALTATVYICDSIGKRVAETVTKSSDGLSFDLKAANQYAGCVTIEIVWTTATSGNKRMIAKDIVEYINDPDGIDGEIDNIKVVITAYKSAITYS